MELVKKSISEAGSCNFCRSSEIDKTSNCLIFSYKEVYVLCGNTISVNLCEKCLKKLAGKINFIDLAGE
jgi:hypothetical protein